MLEKVPVFSPGKSRIKGLSSCWREAQAKAKPLGLS